jgi:hypothetical protein
MSRPWWSDMRATKNLISEAELVTDSCDPAWPAVWGAEVLGRAIGHELRHELETEPARVSWPPFADFIDPALDIVLVGYHIADVL